MTSKELIRKGSHKVRRSSDLMAFYLEIFENEFGRKPNCAGCTFSTDFNRLKNRILKTENTNQKIKIMETKKPIVRKKYFNKIFTYKKNRRPVRTYGRDMTEYFAKKYLENGGDESIFIKNEKKDSGKKTKSKNKEQVKKSDEKESDEVKESDEKEPEAEQVKKSDEKESKEDQVKESDKKNKSGKKKGKQKKSKKKAESKTQKKGSYQPKIDKTTKPPKKNE